MVTNPSTAAVPTLAPLQLREWLWSDPKQQVYAVTMGSRLPQLAERLATELKAGRLQDFDCLLPGALPPLVRAKAPYLVQLKAQSGFSDWVLFEAAAALGEWGVLLRSEATLMPLRAHARTLLQAHTPDGQQIALDWMDPQILRALLPLFAARELEAFMGPVSSWVLPGVPTWQVASAQLGKLDQRSFKLALQPAGAA